MDHNDNVRLVEKEENSGWTLLSTVHDGEHRDKLSIAPDLAEGLDESIREADNAAAREGKSEEGNDDSDDAEEILYSERDNDADDELTDYGVDEGAEEEGSPLSDCAAREYVWEPESVREAGIKQNLVEEQPAGHKQGLMWRVSLVATLGFFGWAVLSGVTGSVKNIRCLKLHPCSLKEGESALNSS